ncbi:helix-turn-helix domain-containing protein [Pseudoduganella sp. LjRoot289]|uniref:GlxA family transcriptional regulator n=1 Tax=Pseudoduganella sp. LjRoot289 TaxID=3342314 RepID=UPI003ED11676
MKTVAVIAYDGIGPFHLSVPCMVFGTDDGDTRPRLFEVKVCGATPGSLRTSAGFSIQTSHGLADVARADIVIMPSWSSPDEAPPQALLEALRQAKANGAQVVGLCLGAFVLAAAGLLDGRPASVHHQWARKLAERYPGVAVNSHVLYIDDGDVITSAGTAAGIDCCLHVLRQRCGASVASATAGYMVMPSYRHGGQAQRLKHELASSAAADLFRNTLDWVLANLREPHTVEQLAARACMSQRTFTRRFRQETGASVHQWLLDQRLLTVQRQLEQTGHTVEVIAGLTGFGSSGALRKQFGKQLGMSPSAYRMQYRA